MTFSSLCFFVLPGFQGCLPETTDMSGLVFGVVRGVIIGVPTGLRFGVEAVSDPSGVASL